MATGKTVCSTILLPDPLLRHVYAIAHVKQVSSAGVIRQEMLHYLSTRIGQSGLPLGIGRQ